MSGNQVLLSRPFKLVSAAFNIPHPEKSATGGEDAYYISSNELSIGVADGVGGWKKKFPESDAAKYARDMMKYCCEISCEQVSPFKIVKQAYDKLDFSIYGSTTVSVGRLHDKVFSICNVGDSATYIYREGRQIFKTTETTSNRLFDLPYQLGFKKVFEPEDCTLDHIDVHVGDVILCMTDGVHDNVYDDNLEQIVSYYQKINYSHEEFVEKLSNTIAVHAHRNSHRNDFISPYNISEQKFKGRIEEPIGGKMDDITIVCSVIVNGYA